MAGAHGNARRDLARNFGDSGFQVTGRKFNLDLRPVFRKVGREFQAEWVQNIVSAFPKLNDDGRPTGGSLASDLSKANILKVKRWWFILRLSKIPRPARLRWFNRGTYVKRKRGSRNFTLAPWEIARRGARGGAQIPRASRPLMDEKTIMRKVQAEAQKQFDSWQRISSRKGKG